MSSAVPPHLRILLRCGASSLALILGLLDALGVEIARESFEKDGPGYDTGLITVSDSFHRGPNDFWTRTTGVKPAIVSASGSPAYSGSDGDHYWAGQDLDTVDDHTDTVIFGPIGISKFTNLRFDGLFAADGTVGSSGRYDPGEGLEVAWSIDGTTYITALAFKSELSSGTNGRIRKDTNLDGVGDERVLVPTFSSHGFDIASTGTELYIRVTGISNGSQEEFAFDNLSVSGVLSEGNQAPTVSTVVAPDVGEPEIGDKSYSFTVQYGDDSAVSVKSIDAKDVTITVPNGVGTVPVKSARTFDRSGSPLTAIYAFTPPGGTWDSSDNGTYTINSVADQVGDDGKTQRFVASGPIGTFTVKATNTRPEVTCVAAPNVTHQHMGTTTYSFTLTYTDVGGIDVSSIDTGDVTLNGGARVVMVSVSGGDGSPRTATYIVRPPGGYWDPSDDGLYRISMIGSQVNDTAGASVAAASSLATFEVDSSCIVRESFESPSPNYDTGLVSAPDQFYASTSDFWTSTDGGDIISASTPSPPAAYRGSDGKVYWAGQDLDHTDNATDTVSIGPIAISGFTDLRFSGLFAADGVLNGVPRFDAGDGLEVAWSIDGSGFSTALAFKAAGELNTPIRQDTNFDGIGNGLQLEPIFTPFAFPIDASGDHLTIRIRGISDGSQEEFAFDDLKISGKPPSRLKYDEWATDPANFDPETPADQRKDTENPEKDELTNLDEFYHGRRPQSSESHPIEAELIDTDGQSVFEVSFPRQRNLSGVGHRFEIAVQLPNWIPVTPVSESIEIVDAETEIITAQILVNNQERLFVRLVIVSAD